MYICEYPILTGFIFAGGFGKSSFMCGCDGDGDRRLVNGILRRLCVGLGINVKI